MRTVSRKIKFTVLILIAGIFVGGVISYNRGVFMSSNSTKKYYQNPLEVKHIGDPFVLKDSTRRYYLYATSASDGFKVWSSTDLVNWKNEDYAYKANKDSWGYANFWAPEVVKYNGKYYMYYTASLVKNGSLRIGVAVSSSPTGPFVDVYDHPMFDFNYAAIDADVLVDDNGRKYMYFSKDCSENIMDSIHESHIYGIELNDDMISTKGEPVLLLKPDSEWEKKSGNEYRWNEGPYALKKNGTYYLMYSANCYSSRDYSVGYATSKSPLGPFVKYDKNPILSAGDNPKVSGPGHNSVTVSPDGEELFIVYHTHVNPLLGGGDRQFNIDRMHFNKDGSIAVDGPTTTKQSIS